MQFHLAKVHSYMISLILHLEPVRLPLFWRPQNTALLTSAIGVLNHLRAWDRVPVYT